MEADKMAHCGIFCWFSFPLPVKDRLQLIKQAGFDAISLWWADADRHLQPDMARRLGLHIDNIHTPFKDANNLWIDGIDGEGYQDMLITCIDDCAQHDIRTAVVHITGFSDPPPLTQVGLNRIRKIVEIAERSNVFLAFENLNYLQHLDYAFGNLQSDHLGFCYDSGHENRFHPNVDCLSRYGHRLLAVHIDDNFGDHDAHLLPKDGTIDWVSFKQKLDRCKSIDFHTLEVDFDIKSEKGQVYQTLSAKEFLSLAYKRLIEIG
jgi:L-ribulose-5-phosphate 3-epimerase